MIQYITIDDPIQDPLNDCVEVTIKIKGKRKRWCFFVTAKWLSNCITGMDPSKSISKGSLEMTQITYLSETVISDDGEKFQYIGVPHMIIVNELNPIVIEKTIEKLMKNNDLLTQLSQHKITI